MKKAIIIPYRGTISDKSRLHTDLEQSLLESLLHNVTQHVLQEALGVKGVDRVYLLTQKNNLGFRGNYERLLDKGEGLNDSIQNMLYEIKEEVRIIIMADLPLVTSQNIQEVIDYHISTNDVVLAPTEDNGTSIICFNKNINLPRLFGKNSSLRFKEYFKNNEIGFNLLNYRESYRDIDTFKDLIKISKNELLSKELISIFKECVKIE